MLSRLEGSSNDLTDGDAFVDREQSVLPLDRLLSRAEDRTHSIPRMNGAVAIARHRSLPVERRNARRPRRDVL